MLQTGFESLYGSSRVVGPAYLADAKVQSKLLMDLGLLFCSTVLVPALSLGLRYD